MEEAGLHVEITGPDRGAGRGCRAGGERTWSSQGEPTRFSPGTSVFRSCNARLRVTVWPRRVLEMASARCLAAGEQHQHRRQEQVRFDWPDPGEKRGGKRDFILHFVAGTKERLPFLAASGVVAAGKGFVLSVIFEARPLDPDAPPKQAPRGRRDEIWDFPKPVRLIGLPRLLGTSTPHRWRTRSLAGRAGSPCRSSRSEIHFFLLAWVEGHQLRVGFPRWGVRRLGDRASADAFSWEAVATGNDPEMAPFSWLRAPEPQARGGPDAAPLLFLPRAWVSRLFRSGGATSSARVAEPCPQRGRGAEAHGRPQ